MPTAALALPPDGLAIAGRDLARALDPVLLMTDAGLDPDHWQVDVLRSEARRQVLCCCRQSGKSTVAGAKALHVALYEPSSLVLLLSPSLRQSGELFRKVLDIYKALDGMPDATAESALRLELPNRSRVVSLPGAESTIRGYSSPSLLVIDEAAHCSQAFLQAILPSIVANPKARLLLLSTPNARQGVFFEVWHSDADGWHKTRISWRECPRISQEAVEFYRRTAGELMFRQEMECEFLDCDEAVFASELIAAAFTPDVGPLWQ